jgi:hypothetical protein
MHPASAALVMIRGGRSFHSGSVARIPGLKRETWGTLPLDCGGLVLAGFGFGFNGC